MEMTRVYGIRGMNRLIGSIMFIGIKMFIGVFIPHDMWRRK